MATPRESRYRVLELIDSGGMAEVYKATSRAVHGIEKVVAIKRILPHLTKNKRFVTMFLDEARLSVHLNHANIVQVFDIGVSGGSYFLVMEYVEGVNLRTLFDSYSDSGRLLPIEVSIYVLMEVLKGLSYAHEKRDPAGRRLSIVHRDVSPPNVMLSIEGEVKLTDFGLAKAASQLDQSDPEILKGKLSYMSPEQAYGRPVDQRSDLFAAGILLFEILTSRRLFKGESDIETLEMVRATRIPSIAKLNPRVPSPLEEIVRRALSRDSDARYPSAREFEEDLARFLFANSLKVTSSDLARVVKDTLGWKRAITPVTRVPTIKPVVEEEIGQIRSLAARGDPSSGGDSPTGSRPSLRASRVVSPSASPSSTAPVGTPPLTAATGAAPAGWFLRNERALFRGLVILLLVLLVVFGILIGGKVAELSALRESRGLGVVVGEVDGSRGG